MDENECEAGFSSLWCTEAKKPTMIVPVSKPGSTPVWMSSLLAVRPDSFSYFLYELKGLPVGHEQLTTWFRLRQQGPTRS